MTYAAIDGDVADFIDSMIDVTEVFRTDELHGYLLSEGHAERDVLEAIDRWQKNLFQPLDPTWETFGLTGGGVAALEELRGHQRS